MPFTRDERLAQANALIQIIAAHGRRFFFYAAQARTAHLSSRGAGQVLFHDAFSGKAVKILPARLGLKPEGFTSGGTLWRLVERLAEYVDQGRLMHREFIAPGGYSYGDLWAYGADAAAVREAAFALPLFEPAQEPPLTAVPLSADACSEATP